MQVLENGKIKAWIDGVDLEDTARQQLINMSKMPFIHKHIAVMPDVHWGRGATVGSVIATKDAIIPAAVGVDIGCGMIAQRLSLKASDLPDNLKELRSAIESAVPHGRTDDGGVNDRGAWGDQKYVPQAHLTILKEITDKHPKLERASKRVHNHIGTLGSGNHFIEICLDEEQRVWVMLHSGSRGIGNAIGTYFIDLAKQDMKKWFINLPDADLAYLPQGSDNFSDYIKAVHWSQEFALLNRRIMMDSVIDQLRKFTKPFRMDVSAVECHHNYVSFEHHFGKNVILTRKGAVAAHKGTLGIIPGSMGAKSFIVEGKGNHQSYNSCSHGAGRVMSRGEARKHFNLNDHEQATLGVECRKDIDVIDETPGAYKDIDAVMAAQADLIDIKHTLKQILCVKG